MKVAAAKAEKKQQRIDAGLLSELFPKVKEISISMIYSQTGVLAPLSRTVNFFPSSYAVFKVSCLCSDCLDGGFDFAKIMSTMVRTRKTISKGKINCKSCSAPECSDVSYTIMIKYAGMK
jgi:hypothetical protein